MSTLLQILDEICGTALFGVACIALPMIIVQVPSFLLLRLPFDDPQQISKRYENATSFFYAFAIMGFICILLSPIIVPIEHFFPHYFYVDADGNRVGVPSGLIRATAVVSKLYELLKAQGLSPGWSSLWTALVGLGTAWVWFLGVFAVLKETVRFIKNKKD